MYKTTTLTNKRIKNFTSYLLSSSYLKKEAFICCQKLFLLKTLFVMETYNSVSRNIRQYVFCKMIEGNQVEVKCQSTILSTLLTLI
ncbi:MAG: hypothetical protein A2W05_05195 [Candidatus Schekmanbacteria bacterium RBG_16_38_10]|uniref:Uncharacterized protein n=1 Tax=Candidatus Schekmanbacteria bacterium RBG_16_38_10 TaxID=1817879 RepID=A0A1F7RRJ0_9BACT|nr:MAG: hypothetical protein A2W05_05195 [Candidatus Schekmanbacteria bacterium RBG_16_38_10]